MYVTYAQRPVSPFDVHGCSACKATCLGRVFPTLAMPSSDRGALSDGDLEQLPPHVQRCDPLFGQPVCRMLEDMPYHGKVHEISFDPAAGERVYFILYHDGEVEHLNADEVRGFQAAADAARPDSVF